MTISRCLIAEAGSGSAVEGADASELLIECSNVFDNYGDFVGAILGADLTLGNRSENPLLCGDEDDPGALAANSPCLDDNGPCGRIGADRGVCDPIVLPRLEVRPDGSGDAPTIQAAIDAIPAGGEIVLGDGVYAGEGNRDLDLAGKAILIRSESGDPASCVIDAGVPDCAPPHQPHRGFGFSSGEASGSQVRGITVMNGCQPIEGGGGVLCEGEVFPRLVNCVIENSRSAHACDGAPGAGINCTDGARIHLQGTAVRRCVAYGAGGGLYCVDGAVIEDCIFEENGAVACGFGVERGGGFLLLHSEVHRTLVRANRAGWGGGGYVSSTRLVDCTVVENVAEPHESWGLGGGLFLSGTDCELVGTTIVGNAARDALKGSVGEGGGVYVQGAMFTRCLFWENCIDDGVGSAMLVTDTVFVNCSILDPGRVEGTVVLDGLSGALDPQFCEEVGCAVENSYEVHASSPTLPAHSPCGQRIGAVEEGCGVVGLEATSQPPAVAWIRAHPNPFGVLVQLRIRDLPTPVPDEALTVDLFDVEGRRVARVQLDAGGVGLWDGTTRAGAAAPPGVYFARHALGGSVARIVRSR